MTDGSQNGVLSSLRMLDKARAAATDVVRDEGSNVDVFFNPEGEEIALCHLSGMLAFTFGNKVPAKSTFDDAAGIALAAHHLNIGDGSIVPQVQGLDKRCNIRFTTEFADTEYSRGVILNQVMEQINRKPGSPERQPCAFIGAYRSAVSIPMSIVTGIFGYPQVSGASTSADLDDGDQYPLFARTVPSDTGNAIPIIIYMRNVLNIKHLAVINENDAYGNSYVEGLRLAAQDHAPDMLIHQIPLDDGQGSIVAAVASLKNTEFRFVFAIVFTVETHDALLTEAYKEGVAGTGKHNWLFGDSFLGVLEGRQFKEGSPLHKSYSGVGVLEVSGGVAGIPAFDNYVSKINELKNPEDLEYLGSLWPKHDHPNYGTEPPFIDDKEFLTTVNGFSPFFYDAAISLGLAACAAVSSEDLSLNGQGHFDSLVTTAFTGASGNVLLNNSTGTRDPSSALYKVANYIEEEDIDPATGLTVVRFNAVVTNLFQDSEWNELKAFIFNDGTTNLPLDLPPPVEAENDVNLAMVIGVPVVVAFIVGAIIFLFYEHKRKENDSVWHVKKEELKFSEPPDIIGRGAFGVVLLAEYRGTQVAVKRVIPPSSKGKKSGKRDDTESSRHRDESESGTGHVSASYGMTSSHSNPGNTSWSGSRVLGSMRNSLKSESANRQKLKQEFLEEMRFLSKLRHPCITTVMGAVIERGEEPMLVMEYMDHGSLYDLLHNETMIMEGELLLTIIQDVSQGVRFLHTANPQVIHGDLKAANILVDSRFRAKVADFGLSQNKNLGGTATPFWMAPELLRRESINTAETDVYSFGVILYEVYSRKDPYEGEDPKTVLSLVADKSVRKRPPVPKNAPPQMQSLMTDCLCEEPEKRPSFEELDVRVKRIDVKSADPGQTGNKASSISLFDIFPRHIAETLQAGRTVEPEHRDSVTIFFSDIVGFTNISSTLPPRKVANMLDRLYTKLDALSNTHDIFKVETIGDAYMAVTNLVKDQPDDHAKRIAEFAIDAIVAANGTYIDIEDHSKGFVNIRVGFHSGSIVADVVGTRNPRYCLFGDAVNTSSRMESNSKVNRIHCSSDAADLLKVQCPEMPLKSRGRIPIKGKGKLHTFWVNETQGAPKLKSISTLDQLSRTEQHAEDSDDNMELVMEEASCDFEEFSTEVLVIESPPESASSPKVKALPEPAPTPDVGVLSEESAPPPDIEAPRELAPSPDAEAPPEPAPLSDVEAPPDKEGVKISIGGK